MVGPALRVRDNSGRFGFFFAAIRPDMGRLVAVVILLASSVLLSFAFPFMMRYLIDVVLPLRQATVVFRITLAVAVLCTIQVAVSFLSNCLYVLSAQGFAVRVRREMYERLLRLGYVEVGTIGSGDVISRIMADVDRIQQFYLSVALRVITALVTLAIALFLLVMLSPQLTVLAVVLVPLQWLIYQAVAGPTQEMSRSVQRQGASVSGCIAETVRGIVDIKCLAAESWCQARFEAAIRCLRDLRIRLHMVVCAASHLGTLLLSLAPLAVLFRGSLLILNEGLTIGTLVAFIAVAVRMYQPLDTLAGLNMEYRSIVGAVERVWELMTDMVCEPEAAGPPPVIRQWGRITLTDVSYRYSDDTPLVLSHLSLSIEPGERVALVGDNGSGKTTVARLILGLIRPTAGRVEIDGVDVSRIPRGELRRRIGFVSGDAYVFNATLRDNMLLACPDAPDDRINSVLDEMGLAGEGLELDSILGEAGVRLSLGQRQRLALARALINHPEVLIIDEATSSLDPGFERRLIDTVDQRFADRTIVFVAHRESSLARATRWVALRRPA